MSVRLTITMKGEPGGAGKAKVVVLDDERITLGRGDDCDVQLAQQAVSQKHAQITRDDTLFFLQDLGSRYGTKINGAALSRGEKRLLNNGDTIIIAQFDVVFDRVAELQQSLDNKPASTAFISAHVVRGIIKGLGKREEPYLRLMNGPKEGERIQIAAAHEYIVGRDDTADIQLTDDLVSRRHAKIRRDWAGVSVEDLESRNGVRVNRRRLKRINGKLALTLKDRDEVQIGNAKFLFIDPSEIREPPKVIVDEEIEETNAIAPSSSELPPEPEAPVEETAAVVPEEAPPAEVASDEPDLEALEAAPELPEEQYAEPPDEEPEAQEPLSLLENRSKLLMLAGVGLLAIVGIVLLLMLVFGA